MKKIILLLALAFIGCDRKHHHKALKLTAVADDSPIVLAIEGQSNGTSGVDTLGEPFAISVTGMVTVTNVTIDNTTFRPSDLTPAHYSITWVYLADMLAAQTGREVHIVNASVGSTSTNQWVDRSTGLMNTAANMVSTYDPCAILWVQGESDWKLGFKHYDTRDNMKDIIGVMHGRAPDALFMIALDGNFNGEVTDEVVTGQREVIASGIAVQGGDMQAIRAEGLAESPGGAHLSDAGKRLLAKQFFDSLMKYHPWDR